MLKGNKFFDNSHRIFCECLMTRSRLTASREMLFGQNWIFPNSDRSYRSCIAIVSQLIASCESFCASEVSLAITLWLRCYCLTREKCVFSVLYSRYDSFFKHLDISLALTLFELFSTQITISFKPHHFQAKSLQSPLKVCVSNTFFIFYFRIMQNMCLGF